ncbi:MAG: ribosome small subunit-dependent GTPase A [Bdellovibrionales bacterium]|nr:ribosome small subunit-dependent GTPase A [Bdellovibrionales bacterium]
MSSTGVISEVFPKMANVILDEDETRKVLCSYRRGQIVDRDSEWRERSPVAPGDRVTVHLYGSKDGVIEEVAPRRNFISRRAPGREGKIMHTIAANLDFVVITSSLHQPDFSPGLVDRFLIATTASQITPLIVINKMDLASPGEYPWKLYEDLGYRCFPVSSSTGEGLNALKETLRGKTSVFCGHSGVGKTSMLSELFGDSVGKTGAVSGATGKGKHTTTVSKLITAGENTRFIDTPGIKEFGLLHVSPKELIQYFPELYELQLRHEPYEHLPRFESYLRIKAALESEGR